MLLYSLSVVQGAEISYLKDFCIMLPSTMIIDVRGYSVISFFFCSKPTLKQWNKNAKGKTRENNLQNSNKFIVVSRLIEWKYKQPWSVEKYRCFI